MQCTLTHWGRVTQICAFTLQRCRTGDANLRFNTRYILHYAVHGACLRMVLVTDVYRNVTSLRVNRLRICYKFLKKQSIKVELQYLEPGNGGLNNLMLGPQYTLRTAHRIAYLYICRQSVWPLLHALCCGMQDQACSKDCDIRQCRSGMRCYPEITQEINPISQFHQPTATRTDSTNSAWSIDVFWFFLF
jgi:hypothetical protein